MLVGSILRCKGLTLHGKLNGQIYDVFWYLAEQSLNDSL